jgi:hypothetical protein
MLHCIKAEGDVCFHEYWKLAEHLIQGRNYEALISVIAECRSRHTFVVMECASGFGKSQAGTALSVLDWQHYIMRDSEPGQIEADSKFSS